MAPTQNGNLKAWGVVSASLLALGGALGWLGADKLAALLFRAAEALGYQAPHG